MAVWRLIWCWVAWGAVGGAGAVACATICWNIEVMVGFAVLGAEIFGTQNFAIASGVPLCMCQNFAIASGVPLYIFRLHGVSLGLDRVWC